MRGASGKKARRSRDGGIGFIYENNPSDAWRSQLPLHRGAFGFSIIVISPPFGKTPEEVDSKGGFSYVLSASARLRLRNSLGVTPEKRLNIRVNWAES